MTMETLSLEPKEIRTLRMVLQSRLSGLISEIDHTDSRAFRELLRDQATILENLIARMPPRPQG
jgi:hypothetical protein